MSGLLATICKKRGEPLMDKQKLHFAVVSLLSVVYISLKLFRIIVVDKVSELFVILLYLCGIIFFAITVVGSNTAQRKAKNEATERDEQACRN